MKRFVPFLVLILSYLSYLSQEYSFVQYSIKEGLPQTQVYSLATDDEGHVWMGTAGGAAKFNGKHFVHYSTSNGLADNVVTDIINYKGYIWIFTNKGVSRVDGPEVKSYNFIDVLQGNYIAAVEFRSSSNSLIIGLKNHEIVEVPLDNKCDLMVDKFSLLSSEITFGNIRSLYEDQEGKIWIASNGYFGYLSQENQWIFKDIQGSSLNVSNIKQDYKGNYYVSVYQEGLYYWNEETLSQTTTEDGLLSQLIRTIQIDSKGQVWLSSKNGVTVLNQNEIVQFNTANGLPNENIETICEDREGNIWLASDGSGVYRFTSDEFVSYHTKGGIGSEYIMNTFQDSSGHFWFGTYGRGITEFDGVKYHYYNIENQVLTNNVVWSSLLDSKGRKWFGTSNGLFLFEEEEVVAFRNEEWLPSNKVTGIFENEQTNEIWFGTSKGLAMYGDDTTKSIKQSELLKLKNIRSLAKGKNGHVWLGTSNGIFITDGNYCEPWVFNDQLSDKVVYTIKNFKDSLWFIGTSNGLYHSDGLSVEKMEIHPSFGANYINFIGVENDQFLWVGTNYGIFEISIYDYLKNPKKGVLHHTENSGLQSLETNLNSVFVDAKGIVWMGTGEGLVRFDRSRRKASVNKTIPNISISEVQLFLKPTNWSNYDHTFTDKTIVPDGVSLSSRKNYLTVYFEGLSYTHPADLKYKVFLEGLDEDWTPIIDQPSFTYPNLSYGNYTFHVKASIDGINWCEPSEFSFEIRKPYYLTYWFIGLCLLIGTVLIYLVYLRRQKIKEQKRETEQLKFKSKLLALEQQTLNASMNRHFIFNALNSIQYYINTQDRLSANRYLTSFAKLIRKNLDSSVSESGVVSLSDELERLELYVSLEHMRFQEKFDYELEVNPNIDTEQVQIPAMILQPFVENSIWHGLLPKEDGGKLWVRIFPKGSKIIFEIEDNGIGFEVSHANKTNNQHHSKGMLITSGRLDVLKKVNEKKMSITGPFQINGEEGQVLGTKVIITLEDLVS